jgi:iron complex transport system permease protein
LPIEPLTVLPEVCLHRYLIGASVAMLALFLYSFTIGPYPVPLDTIVAVFLHRFHLLEKTWSDTIDLVVLNGRGPRIVAALLVGATLA